MLLTAGCVTHRGAWQPAAATPGRGQGVDLVLLANTGGKVRRAEAVGSRVQQIIGPGSPAVVLWLGDLVSDPRAQRRRPRCTTATPPWRTPGLEALAAATGRPGVPRFAVPGVLDWRCEQATALRPGGTEAPPWQIPGTHYVVRVHVDGSTHLRAWCQDGGCRFDMPPPGEGPRTLADLVVVDLAPWLYPPPPGPARRLADLQVEALDAMLVQLAQTPPDTTPPRLLVSSVPVEAAAEHGLGALRPDATFHNLPPRLQGMLLEGHFAGVLCGHDRSMTAGVDLSDALKRSDRAWLRAPVFQVTAGAVSRPNRRPAVSLRRRRVRSSQAWRAPVFSDHPGFAVLRLEGERAELTLHAYRWRRWETASLSLPLRPTPHPARTASPVMAPCRDCPRIPINER